jgi:sugar/nucleoside kinase (ribokinase family)
VKVVCAGLATVDVLYTVDRIPGVDEKAQATSVEVAAGGPAANAAITAALLGAEVTLVSAVGAHPLGALIRDDLDRYGVRLVDAAAGRAGPPPVSAITVLAATGQRTIVSRNAGDLAAGVPVDLDLAGADAVLVDGHHPALAVAAARAGRPLVVDAGSWRPVFADVLPHALVVACSAAFRAPDPVLLAGVPHVAVTDGPRPVRWRSGPAEAAGGTAETSGGAAETSGGPAETSGGSAAGRTSGGSAPGGPAAGGPAAGAVPVPAVAAVDTAGAGDVFHGALAVAVARDPEVRDFPGALAYAVSIAARRVVHRGPRAWRQALNGSGRAGSPAPS